MTDDALAARIAALSPDEAEMVRTRLSGEIAITAKVDIEAISVDDAGNIGIAWNLKLPDAEVISAQIREDLCTLLLGLPESTTNGP